MKRILCLLLALTVSVSMAACSKSTQEIKPQPIKPSYTSPAVTKPVEQENDSEQPDETTTVGDESYWKLEALDAPDISIKVEDVKVFEDSNIVNKIGRITHSYSVEDIKEQLAADEFISSYYVLGILDSEETDIRNYDDVGLQKKYHYHKAIVGVLKENATDSVYFNDFGIYFYGDTNRTDGYDYITVKFEGVGINTESQDKIYDVLKKVFPEDICRYLVYASDEDNPTYKDLTHITSDDNFHYKFERTLTFGRDNKLSGNDMIEFSFGQSDTKFYNSYEFYSGDYQPELTDMKYIPSKFFSPRMGALDIQNPDNFLDEYFKIGSDSYIKTVLRNDWFQYRRIVGDNGINKYEVRFEAVAGEPEISLLVCPFLSVSYTVMEKDGEVIDMHWSIENRTLNINDNEDMEKSFKKLHDNMIKQIKCILGEDVDLSELDYDNLKTNSGTKKTGKTSVPVVFKGTEQTVTIDMTLGHNVLDCWNGSFELKISLFE